MAASMYGLFVAYAKIIQEVCPDLSRAGLAQTPERAAKSILECTSGYSTDMSALLTCFEDGSPDNPAELIIVSSIRSYSTCEHHLAPFFGLVHVGYVPGKKIIGLSKIARVVEAFSRRLQVQERMTNQIADFLTNGLDCPSLGVVAMMRHMCMEMRGVRQAGTITTTSALRGTMKSDPDLRREFFGLIPTTQGMML